MTEIISAFCDGGVLGRDPSPMTAAELRSRLNGVADSLAPVAAALMQRACGDREEHAEGCDCYTCRAFLATHAAVHELESIARQMSGPGAPPADDP